MIGYHCTYDHSLIGMVMTQGRQREVINLGIGIKELCVDRESPNTPVSVYAESLHHKVRRSTIISCDMSDTSLCS